MRSHFLPYTSSTIGLQLFCTCPQIAFSFGNAINFFMFCYIAIVLDSVSPNPSYPRIQTFQFDFCCELFLSFQCLNFVFINKPLRNTCAFHFHVAESSRDLAQSCAILCLSLSLEPKTIPPTPVHCNQT